MTIVCATTRLLQLDVFSDWYVYSHIYAIYSFAGDEAEAISLVG